MKNRLKLFAPLFISALLSCLILPLGAISFEWKACAALFGFAVVTAYFLSGKQRVPGRILLFISIPPLCIYLPIHISDFSDTLLALPSSGAHLIGIGIGYFYNSFAKKKLLVAVVCIVAIVGYAFFGFQSWADWVQYRSLTKDINFSSSRVMFTGNANRNITDSVLRKPIVVIDFWNTGCGPCFKKFPEFEQIFSRWKSDPEVSIFSVNVPLARDTIGQGEDVIRSEGYTFPVIYSTFSQFSDTFGLNSFPSILILYRGNSIEPVSDIADLDRKIIGLKNSLSEGQ